MYGTVYLPTVTLQNHPIKIRPFMWVNIAGNLGMMFEMPFFVLHFQTRSWLQLRESRSTSFDSFPFTTSESYAYRTVKTGCVRTRGFTNNSQERQLKTTFPPCVIALSLCCIKIWIIVYLKDLPLTFACSKVMFDQTSTDLVQETTVRVLPMLNSETNLTTTLFSYRLSAIDGYWRGSSMIQSCSRWSFLIYFEDYFVFA